jgi:hypothetical protein
MNKSTGTTEVAPFNICGWPMNGPPAIAQAPTAMTIFGEGRRLVRHGGRTAEAEAADRLNWK